MRAGQFVRQPSGYTAFIPAELPPDPPLRLDQLRLILSEADLALGRLDGVTTNLPNPDLFVAMYVREEALLSAQIEGTQASLTDVLEFEAGHRNAESPGEIASAVAHVRAMNYGLNRLTSLPLSLRLIREIHRELMEGVRGEEQEPGEFRRRQNWIGPANCTLPEAIFVPPPAHELLPALSNLETYIRATAQPPLIQAGLAHAQFETIHPFLDGNGRIGRLLITFILCTRRALSQPLLYLSHYLKRHRSEYYDRLQAVRVDGDWERWLGFFLTG
ncbi:MAG: cell filamentation protein Fic, partial [Dehalococcoidia bacterium]|nr:cell filamentation protein Fic [Dehalococcoidia bacterium]